MFKNSWKGQWRGKAPSGDVHVRSREVVRPTGSIMRGKFPSRKNGRMVHYEGLLEGDAVFLFETSPNIVCYREQPRTILYPDGNKLRRYTPDFELTLTTGETLLVEVKHVDSLKDPELIHKLACIDTYLTRSGQQFHVLTSDAIRLEPRLSNCKEIRSGLPRIWPQYQALQNLCWRLKPYFPLPYQDAKKLLDSHQYALSSLIVAGLITLDISQPLQTNCHVHINKELHHESFWIAKKYGY